MREVKYPQPQVLHHAQHPSRDPRRVRADSDSLRGVKPPCVPALLLSLCLAVAGTPVAHADTPTVDQARLAVLPLRVDGAIDDDTQARWNDGLRAGLERGDAVLAEPEKFTPYIEGNCDRQSCYDRVRANSGATHLVRATVVNKNRDFLLKIDLIDARTGQVVLSNNETCEICGADEVAGMLDAQGALLQTRLSAMGAGPAVLVLETKPNGAIVYVDGEAVGTTPLERPVLAGSHKIRISLDGYVAEERELTLVNGVREELSLPLQRLPGNPKTRALGAAGLVSGLSLLVGGVVLTALDDTPYRRNCTGMNVDPNGVCKFLYGTGPLGAVLIGAGAVLGTLGAVALHRHRGSSKRTTKSKATARARFGPSGLSISGQF